MGRHPRQPARARRGDGHDSRAATAAGRQDPGRQRRLADWRGDPPNPRGQLDQRPLPGRASPAGETRYTVNIHVVEAIVLVLTLILAAFSAAAETAFTALSPATIHMLEERGGVGRVIAYLKHEPNRFL